MLTSAKKLRPNLSFDFWLILTCEIRLISFIYINLFSQKLEFRWLDFEFELSKIFLKRFMILLSQYFKYRWL